MSTRLGRKVDEMCRALEELAAARSDRDLVSLSEVAAHLGIDEGDVRAIALYGVRLLRVRVEGDPPHSVAIKPAKSNPILER